MKVRFRDARGGRVAERWRLTPGGEYDVIGIEAGFYRIIDDEGEPVLFSRNLFKSIDWEIPECWKKEIGEEGEVYAYPPELSRVGFFEDWHDGQEAARNELSIYLAKDSPVLSDATRRSIMKSLAAGPKNITSLCKSLDLKQPAVSHHLGLLGMGRLVVRTMKGNSVVYTIDASGLKALVSTTGKLVPKG